MSEHLDEDYKKCPRCGLVKRITDFHKHRRRKDGVQIYCKECQKRIVHESECIPLISTGGPEVPPSSHTGHHRFRNHHMMMDDVFKLYYENAQLVQFIRKRARRYSRNEKDIEDYTQMAWMKISMCCPGYAIDYYEDIAAKAIYCEYAKRWRKKKYHLSFLENMDHEEYLMWMTGHYPA